MSKSALSSSARAEQALLIVFADISRFMANSHGKPDSDLAAIVDGYYHHATGLVERAGGRMVKFMGDAFLAVWTEDKAGAGAASLYDVKKNIDTWWALKGWDSRVVIKAHFGKAVAGAFGPEGRFDLIGNEVNVAATLPARTVALSAEAFRCLSEENRKAFKKHSPAVVYIPIEDARP